MSAGTSPDRETRLAWLLDHHKRPRHRGRLQAPDVSVAGGNPECGDVVTVDLRMEADGERIAEVGFEAQGCTLSQAAASIVAERVSRDHPSVREVEEMSYEDLLDLIGRDIAMHRPKCATLALGVVKAAVRRLAMDRQLKVAGYSPEQIEALRAAAG